MANLCFILMMRPTTSFSSSFLAPHFETEISTLHTLNFPKRKQNEWIENSALHTVCDETRRHNQHTHLERRNKYRNKNKQNALDFKIFWWTVAIVRPNSKRVYPREKTHFKIGGGERWKSVSEIDRVSVRERETGWENIHLTLAAELINYADTGNSIVWSSLMQCDFSLTLRAFQPNWNAFSR